MHFYAQVALCYQIEAGTIAIVGGQIKTKEGVVVPEVAARQSVPLVLSHLTGQSGLSLVHGEDVDIVVLGVKRILVVRTIVCLVVDVAHH